MRNIYIYIHDDVLFLNPFFFSILGSFSGIATHYIPSSRIPALEDRLIDLETSEHEIIQRVLEKFVEPKSVNKTGFQKEIREVIDRYGEEEEKKKERWDAYDSPH